MCTGRIFTARLIDLVTSRVFTVVQTARWLHKVCILSRAGRGPERALLSPEPVWVSARGSLSRAPETRIDFSIARQRQCAAPAAPGVPLPGVCTYHTSCPRSALHSSLDSMRLSTTAIVLCTPSTKTKVESTHAGHRSRCYGARALSQGGRHIERRMSLHFELAFLPRFPSRHELRPLRKAEACMS